MGILHGFYSTSLLPEAYCYLLRGRKELGYNVILADFLHTPGTSKPGGESAWRRDFSRIKKDGGFWEHVDQVLKMAESWGFIWGCFLYGAAVLWPEESE